MANALKPDQRAVTADAANAPLVLTPTLLNQQIRRRLADMRDLRVRGEVSQARTSNGHLYFTLKDPSSSVSVTVWRSTVSKLNLRLRPGDEVVCRGHVDHYVRSGRVSFIAYHVQAAGVGALWARFQKLKEQLGKEGLFDADRKKPLPFLPRTVGIVTSPTGAALGDMLRILRDRMATRVVVAGVKVQGIGAPELIANAIAALDRSGLCDVIICGRGGGSIEDLWAFNEEVVVRAVAACTTPIVSAVGHETDTMLSDYAADARAPTPTAAAEMVVPRRTDLLRRIDEIRKRMGQRLEQRLVSHRRELLGFVARLGRGESLLLPARQSLDELRLRLLHAQRQRLSKARKICTELQKRLAVAHPQARLRQRQRALAVVHRRLLRAGPLATQTARHRLTARQATLKALDPRAALRRGYAIVRRLPALPATTPADGVALRSSGDASVGDGLSIVLSEGELTATVTGVTPPGPQAK